MFEMKKSIYLSLIASILVSCTTKPHYVVTGNIEGSDSVMFYLQKREAGRTVTLDSALSRNGNFKMKGGSVSYPQLVQLVAGNSRKRTAFYLENSDIIIKGSLDSLYNVRIKGSRTQDEYDSLIASNKPLSDKYTDIYQRYQLARRANDEKQIAALDKQTDSVQNEMMTLQKDFVIKHPASYLTPSLLTNMSYEMGPEELEPMLNGLDTAIANLPQVKSLKERLEVMKSVAIGQKAPDFTMNDPEGKPVSLYSKVGSKLLLIDFWASWCNPCRQENPNVVKVYKEFHKKGFDVFGVSLDQKRDDWVSAIASDKLTWTHVSDLKYWGNEAARLYAVNSIPSNFLLDQNGTIIGRNLRGADLYNKVKEILDKK
jgi:peroxiredoxin